MLRLMGVSAPSIHRESTDSLIGINFSATFKKRCRDGVTYI